MKDIGRTPTGDWLVQMTSGERAAFWDLILAMEGKNLRDLNMASFANLELDQSCPLFFIRQFAWGRTMLNELLECVQNLVKLMSPEPENAAE